MLINRYDNLIIFCSISIYYYIHKVMSVYSCTHHKASAKCAPFVEIVHKCDCSTDFRVRNKGFVNPRQRGPLYTAEVVENGAVC